MADEHGRETRGERIWSGSEEEDLPQWRFGFFLLAARGDHRAATLIEEFGALDVFALQSFVRAGVE